jgi:hypothetical protein
VIRAFGILNTNVPEDHKMMYGMPWPGDYLIAPDGRVWNKLFLSSYEHRPSASEVLVRNFADDTDGSSVDIKTDVPDATISLSTDRGFPGQEIAWSVRIRLKPGWHIYGNPLPQNYHALDVTFDGQLVDQQSLQLPPPKQMPLRVLGETLPVYTGEMRATGLLGIKWSPPMPRKFLEALGKRIEPGLYKIGGILRFQACTDEVCEAPQAITFELPFTVEAGIPPAPKRAT